MLQWSQLLLQMKMFSVQTSCFSTQNQDNRTTNEDVTLYRFSTEDWDTHMCNLCRKTLNIFRLLTSKCVSVEVWFGQKHWGEKQEYQKELILLPSRSHPSLHLCVRAEELQERGWGEVEQMLPTFGDNNAAKKHQTPNKDQKPPPSFLPLFALVPFFSRLFPFTVFLSASSFVALHLVPFSVLLPTKPFRARRHFHRCQQVRKHSAEN